MKQMITLTAAAILLAWTHTCHARLGAEPSFAKSGTSRTDSPTQSYSVNNYTWFETVLSTGTHVCEYVAKNGKVFAVRWHGPFMPDLKELLGIYFDTMVAEGSKTPAAGNSQLFIKRPSVVIQSGGHMRSYNGRAWIPDQLPNGFSTAELH